MADNVNIIVQDTINDIVVNAAVIVETIDINVQAAVDEVQIIANPNNYVVNINRIIGEQVQSDWDQADDQAPDYIKNKPTIPTATSDLTNDGEDGINPFITAADVTAQVNSDWNAVGGVAEILNKPTIPTNTSDLTNDGEDGVNPFITAADIPATPTLQQVTDAGNETGNLIKSFGGAGESTIDGEKVYTTDFSLDSWAYLHGGGYLGLKSPDALEESYLANNLVEKPGVVLEFPNKPTGSYIIATTEDVPASVTSVGLTMPSAFSVANSPITSAGTLAVTGAGVVSQYVRGDGSLANFPTSTGGGASLSFYLNGSVSQGTIGGVAFREMDRTPILGAGTDFTINANGYIQSFITDANVPNQLEIPAGNWNFETYFSASSGGGSPSFYVELYKWNGTTLSLIASNSATPEGITNGTAIDAYFSALAVPQTTLLATDRLAVRIYVTHSGRTITLHTENSHLCQVITTFSTGLTALNGLTTQVQSFATGTSGTDFGISSATSTHTFNLPTASAANRGALSSTDWSTFNDKFTLPALTSGSVLFSNGSTIAQDNANLFWDDTNNRLGIGITAPSNKLHVSADTNSIIGLGRFENTNVGTAVQSRIQLVAGTAIAQLGLFGSGHSTNPRLFRISGSGDGGDMYLATGGVDRFAITITGNVGIGTTSPVSKLDLGGTENKELAIKSTTSNRAYYAGWQDEAIMSVNRQVSNGTFADITKGAGSININSNAGGSNIKFLTSNTVNTLQTEKMRITEAGNVLINTTTDAGYKLDVNGTARVSGQLTLGGSVNLSTDSTLSIGNATSRILGLYVRVIASGNNTMDILAPAINLADASSNIRLKIFSGTGNVQIQNAGTYTDEASARLTVNSTTQGFLPPRMTTTQKNAIATPAAGLVVYDTTLGKLCVRGAAAWETITSI